MPMPVIAGQYRVRGARPEGGSGRLHPGRLAQWLLLPGAHRARLNAAGGAQLRLDGVDALETHYAIPGRGLAHQPLALGRAAASAVLDRLGFTGVVRAADETVLAS